MRTATPPATSSTSYGLLLLIVAAVGTFLSPSIFGISQASNGPATADNRERPRTITVIVTSPRGTNLHVEVTGEGPAFIPAIYDIQDGKNSFQRPYVYHPNHTRLYSVITVTAVAVNGVATNSSGKRLGEIECHIFQAGEHIERPIETAYDSTRTHKPADNGLNTVLCKRVITPLP
jgi:hypothetical protein